MSIGAIGGNANTCNSAALQGQGMSAARRSPLAATTPDRSDGPVAAGQDGSPITDLQVAAKRAKPDASIALLANLNATATDRQTDSGTGDTNATVPSSGSDAQMKLQRTRLAQAYGLGGDNRGTTLLVAA